MKKILLLVPAVLAGLLIAKRRVDAAAEQDLWAEATKPADLR